MSRHARIRLIENYPRNSVQKKNMNSKTKKTMKTKILLIILGFILITTACSKNNFDTGIVGTYKIGYHDCMPPIDTTNLTYDEYSGTLYFISKSALDPALNYDFQKLKEMSISKKIKKGKLSIELPPDTFLVMTEDTYFNDPANTIIITSGQVLKADIKYWVCTSY